MNDSNSKLEKALKLIDQRGLNGLIIFSDGICNILRPSYLLYFSGFKPMGPRNAAVISKSGENALLVDPPWDEIRASQKTWIKDVWGTKNFVNDLIGVLKKFKITGKIGIVGSREMTKEVYGAIQKETSIEIADDIIEEIAREKTAEEIELVRKTARIADLGVETFVNSVRVGIREYELVAELEFAMRSEGADDIFILMSSGSHNHEMHEPTDRRLRKGDIVIGEITPVCRGQFIQFCPTVFIGKPPEILTEKYQILIRALEASLKEMRTGAPARNITIAMNRVFSEAGYAEYCRPPYMRSRGHGFGVGSIAPGGEITDKMEVNLERYQSVAVHPNQYIPETGYLVCGETVLVMDGGVERLTKREQKLFIKEG